MKKNKNLVSKMLDNSNYNQFIIRITIALVMWPHGAQLLLGWFGGFGFTNTMNYFTGTVGLPYLIGVSVILIQFFGSIFILAGLLTKLNSLLMAAITIGMIFSGHSQNGFFMNWMGNQNGEGFEYHLLLLGCCLSLLLTKKYKFSLDSWLFKN